ncbi:MAG: hypothetical protein H7096_11530 [Flavobacterium sp.]|nr:hypothetical protein [Pedobacter sp.]
MLKLQILLIFCALLITKISFAQVDSSAVLTDSVKPAAKLEKTKTTATFKTDERIRLEKLPGKAALRSAIIPGWGQLSNKRWWKVPLVYGGFVGIVLVYDFNRSNYRIFLTEAQNREFNKLNPNAQKPLNSNFTRLSESGIINIKDYYRRNRDLSVLGGIAFYTINIIDAYVDAKFFRFDISDDLALQLKPELHSPIKNGNRLPVPAIKLSLSFLK